MTAVRFLAALCLVACLHSTHGQTCQMVDKLNYKYPDDAPTEAAVGSNLEACKSICLNRDICLAAAFRHPFCFYYTTVLQEISSSGSELSIKECITETTKPPTEPPTTQPPTTEPPTTQPPTTQPPTTQPPTTQPPTTQPPTTTGLILSDTDSSTSPTFTSSFTADSCSSLCKLMVECAGADFSDSACALYSSVTSEAASPGSTLWRKKACPDGGKDCCLVTSADTSVSVGSDILTLNDALESCTGACDNVVGCEAASYASNTCKLFMQAPERVSAAGVTMYIKGNPKLGSVSHTTDCNKGARSQSSEVLLVLALGWLLVALYPEI